MMTTQMQNEKQFFDEVIKTCHWTMIDKVLKARREALEECGYFKELFENNNYGIDSVL